MSNKTIIASTTVAATLAVAIWFLVKPAHENDGAAPAPDFNAAADTAEQRGPSTAAGDAARRLAAEQEAARILVADFDRFVARLMAGDDSLDGGQRMEMAYRLERAVEFSPVMREALKKRLEAAFVNNEITALMELERAFNGIEVGVKALVEVYAAEVKRGSTLDYYALQNASYFQGAIPEETRNSMIEHSFAQLSKYDKHFNYNGAMLFLSSAIRSGAKIPDHYRDTAIGLIQKKLESAAEGDDQYFAAQNLYKMFSARDAAKRAASILDQRPSYSIAQATLEAIVYGRMEADPTLISRLTRVATERALSREQSLRLQDLLAKVPSNPSNAGNG